MKWLMVAIAALAVGGYFGWRYRAARQAERAVIESVCRQEITDQVMGNFKQSQEARAAGKGALTGAALGLQRKAIYQGSSLAPHLATFQRVGDLPVARVKELAAEASARCPDVFPEPITAEKPIGFVWGMGIDLPN